MKDYIKPGKPYVPSILEAQEQLELTLVSVRREHSRCDKSHENLLFMTIAHLSQANSYLKTVLMDKGLKYFSPEI